MMQTRVLELTARNFILSRLYSPHHFAFKMQNSKMLNGFSHLQNIALLKFLLANKCQVLFYYQEYWAFSEIKIAANFYKFLSTFTLNSLSMPFRCRHSKRIPEHNSTQVKYSVSMKIPIS